MDTVFILWHIYKVEAEADEKLIGVYRTRDDAASAIARLGDKPGFKDCPDGFEIHEYVLGRDGWVDGYISQSEAMNQLKE